MSRQRLIKDGVLITAGISLILSGVTMSEDSRHLLHSLQLIITGAALLVLDRILCPKKQRKGS